MSDIDTVVIDCRHNVTDCGAKLTVQRMFPTSDTLRLAINDEGNGQVVITAADLRQALDELTPSHKSDSEQDNDPDLTNLSMKYCTNVRICAEIGEGCMCSKAERLAQRALVDKSDKTGDNT